MIRININLKYWIQIRIENNTDFSTNNFQAPREAPSSSKRTTKVTERDIS